jgi:Tol biopolymer transport system component
MSGSTASLHIMNRDGSRDFQLTNEDGSDYSPRWSPDGTSIAFYSDREGDYDVFTVDIATRELAQLTDNSIDDTYPVWSPNSSKLMFVSSMPPESDTELFAINIDGTNLQQITDNDFQDEFPIWSAPLPVEPIVNSGPSRVAVNGVDTTRLIVFGSAARSTCASCSPSSAR